MTKQQIKEQKLKTYYKVILYDEDFFSIQETIGRYATLEEAQKEARIFSDLEIDGEDVYIDILEFTYNEDREKYILTDNEFIF